MNTTMAGAGRRASSGLAFRILPPGMYARRSSKLVERSLLVYRRA
jgi:hypothetical protein